MKSVIYIEKFERKPGIYIIFNMDTKNIYIGCLKELDNPDDLDKWESIFYLAAKKLGEDKVYNIV